MPDWLMVALQALVLIGSIFMGARSGGLMLGLWGVVGTLLLVFLLQCDPASPSTDAFFIVISVVTAAGAMQAAGGIDWLVQKAAGIIQKNPSQLVFIAPLTAFAFTVAAGTGNIYFALLPIIYQLAYANGIRPVKALALSAVASQLAITSSPVSAAMAAFTSLLGPEFSSTDVLLVMVPSSVVGLLVAGFIAKIFGGPDIADDAEIQAKIADGTIEAPRPVDEFLKSDLPPQAKASALIFLTGVMLITLMGAFDGLRPTIGAGDSASALGMSPIIQMVMFTVALLQMLLFKVKTDSVMTSTIFKSGIISAIALFGFSWLANTFINNNQETVVQPVADFVKDNPWAFALALFAVAAMTTSQSSATQAIVPIGLASLSVATVIGMWPAVIGIYLFPINGSQVATVATDQTGSTKLGKFMINHAFLVPMLVALLVTMAIAIPLANIIV
ncbi:MAG: anaerobic C4-dicarboxylate transporter [Thermomicrobiales bacterium]|nr:anaerobic C4-dicarboxylate transporter [Thermomicrobiales bacterium]